MSCAHSSRPDCDETSCSQCIQENRVRVAENMTVPMRRIDVIDGWIHIDGVNVGRFDERNREMLRDEATYAGVSPSLRARAKP